MESYTCLWNAAAAYFRMKAHHFYSFFFFKLFKKSLKKKSTGFKSTIKHSFYGPLWSEFVFDCTLTTNLSLTEDILQLQKLYKDVDTVEFVH